MKLKISFEKKFHEKKIFSIVVVGIGVSICRHFTPSLPTSPGVYICIVQTSFRPPIVLIKFPILFIRIFYAAWNMFAFRHGRRKKKSLIFYWKTKFQNE